MPILNDIVRRLSCFLATPKYLKPCHEYIQQKADQLTKEEHHPSLAEKRDEISLALSICKEWVVHMPLGSIWREDCWTHVIECFGEEKSQEIYEKLEQLYDAYFAIRIPHTQGMSVVEEAVQTSEKFLQVHPSAPASLIRHFEDEFIMLRR